MMNESKLNKYEFAACLHDEEYGTFESTLITSQSDLLIETAKKGKWSIGRTRTLQSF